MGDPHGIGPEVLLKSLQHLLPGRSIKPIIFGAEDYLSELYTSLKLNFDWKDVTLFDVGSFPYPPSWGLVDADSGRSALNSLRSAILYCRDQRHALLVTAPVSKEALHLAGFSDPGQTEYVGSFFGPSDPTMVFLSEPLKILLVTVHTSLRNVFQELTIERIVAKCNLFLQALVKLGIEQPRIAVCGLNPHASEKGLFGAEEAEVIIPAMRQLERTVGSGSFWGPYPADTVFARAAGGEFDGVVAHYHDQGLIPLKMVAFDSAVNTTLGLPIIRTSPDHGTAFEIAGKGIADPGSMIAAVEWGIRLTSDQSDH
jgi:4-hydroxythreonine-4-phosphate dehydrogenase